MKRTPEELSALCQRYEQQLANAPVSFWMEAEDFLDLLDHYEQVGQYFEAEQCMRLALRLHPKDPEVVVRRAYRLKNEGRWDEAEAVVRALPDQDSLDVRFFWAELALSQLDYDRAASLYEAALKGETQLDTEWPREEGEEPLGITDLLLEIAELSLDYGSVPMALKYIERIPTSAPEYARAQLLRAECSFQMGDGVEALRRLETLLDDDPYNIEAWVMVADVANELKDFEKCVEAANFALAIEPEHEKALRFRAAALLGLKCYDEVLEVYEVYRRYYPNDYTMALSAGEILMHKGRMADARTVLLRSNRVCPNEHPDKVRILTDISTTYAADGNLKAVYETLLGCTSLGTSYPEVLFEAARLCLEYRHTPDGLRLLQHLLTHHAAYPELPARIARLLVERGVYEGAREIWAQLWGQRTTSAGEAAPYCALAARQLRALEPLLYWLARAVADDPTTTQQLFRTFYPDLAPSDYLQRAKEEFL